MHTHSTDPQSQKSHSPDSNGGAKLETQSDPPERKYVLEDFSQQAINRGQVEINGYLQETNEQIIDALKQFKTAIEKLSTHAPVDLKVLADAITKVDDAYKKVAGPFPPGCGYPPGAPETT
jgi:hypothetical protein